MEYFVGTFWAFVPAIVAIVLALLTKQVYVSLFAGIFVGGMFLAGGNPLTALQNITEVMAAELGGNGGILIFLVVLGIMAFLLVASGGSKAYGQWASKKIKTPKSAQLATIGLGVLIFVDDYFNCLTVGSVMRPITDRQKVPHSKLAYLIDATAAPVCIIAPISSWAAAVAGYVGDEGGIITFIKTIPLNLYAILTIVFMIVIVILNIDFFKMKKNKTIADETGDLNAGETDLPTEEMTDPEGSDSGTIWHLIIPIIVLIVCCVSAMIYNGWSWLHTLSQEELVENIGKTSFNVLDCFSQCDSSIALAFGSILALAITIFYYAVTKVLTFAKCMESLTKGFKAMVPAILILVFAWTLCAMMGAKGEGLVDGQVAIDGTLNAKAFIQKTISADSIGLAFIPFIFFILACVISFATGTSWGTFGVLLPICLAVMSGSNSSILYLAMAATLAGAVYGDHVSPISDTTIMASSGAQCNHIDHVKTQMPYATIVAFVCAVSYLISGLIAQSNLGYGVVALVTLGSGLVLLSGALVAIHFIYKKKNS